MIRLDILKPVLDDVSLRILQHLFYAKRPSDANDTVVALRKPLGQFDRISKDYIELCEEGLARFDTAGYIITTAGRDVFSRFLETEEKERQRRRRIEALTNGELEMEVKNLRQIKSLYQLSIVISVIALLISLGVLVAYLVGK